MINIKISRNNKEVKKIMGTMGMIYPDGIKGEVTLGCSKCGKKIVLVRDGKKTEKKERTCCGCEVDFLHIAVTKKRDKS